MKDFFKLPIKSSNEIGLIGHVIVNHPDPKLCHETLSLMDSVGIDLVEIQMPCSEPIADGPLFMKANHEALQKGVTVDDGFQLVSEHRKKPKVIMTYANLLYARGVDEFVRQAFEVGAKGFIIPDWPIELADELLNSCRKYGLVWIPIVTPNTTEKRMAEILPKGGGFVYSVARAGVTGSPSEMNDAIEANNKLIRQYTDLPIAVGFGISKPEDILFLKPIADYAIVGSAALRALEEGGLEGLRQFWQRLKDVSC